MKILKTVFGFFLYGVLFFVGQLVVLQYFPAESEPVIIRLDDGSIATHYETEMSFGVKPSSKELDFLTYRVTKDREIEILEDTQIFIRREDGSVVPSFTITTEKEIILHDVSPEEIILSLFESMHWKEQYQQEERDRYQKLFEDLEERYVYIRKELERLKEAIPFKGSYIPI